MDRNLDEAKFVLMVCTETYRRRVLGLEEPGKGLGVDWEGNLIYNLICHRINGDKPRGSRFIPILLSRLESRQHIPSPVQGHILLPARDVRPERPGLRGLVSSPDRSACHTQARPRLDQDAAPETATAIIPFSSSSQKRHRL